MNGPKIQQLIHGDLQRAVACAGAPRNVEPLRMSPWVAMAALQKAIRRGRVEQALSAAATLLIDSPDRLWRRLASIAAEDIGLGSLEALRVATAAMAGKRKRAEIGGDWAVAHAVVQVLAAAPKCRAADDLLMDCLWRRELLAKEGKLGRFTARDLAAITAGFGVIEDRALALVEALTARTPKPRRVTEPVFDFLALGGWQHDLVELARLNFNRTGVALAPLVLLLAQAFPADAVIEPDAMPPEADIDGVPGWVFDIYSREGRTAFTLFLGGPSETATWLRAHVTAARRLAVLGHAVFRVEGGLVDRRLRWPLADRLRHEVDLAYMDLEPDQASELLDIVRADVPALNAVREERLRRRH